MIMAYFLALNRKKKSGWNRFKNDRRKLSEKKFGHTINAFCRQGVSSARFPTYRQIEEYEYDAI